MRIPADLSPPAHPKRAVLPRSGAGFHVGGVPAPYACPVSYTHLDVYKRQILDIRDYERLQAEIALASELNKGRKSGEENGWLSAGDVRSHFKDKGNG